jgi:hypothetical protein
LGAVIIRYKSVSKFTLVTTVVFAWALLSCAKQDPFDQAFIEKDLRKHPAQEIHDAADKFTYDAPADRKLTEKQIADYAQVMKLADRIRATAERNANAAFDRASAASGFSRGGEAAAAFGSARNYATAEMRACLNLGVNPKEHEWVAQHVATALSMIDQLARLENDAATKKAASDAEIDPELMTRKRHAFESAADAKERWENDQDPALLENALLVRKHRHEIEVSR